MSTDSIWANVSKICCNFYAFGQLEIYTIFLHIKNLFYMQMDSDAETGEILGI